MIEGVPTVDALSDLVLVTSRLQGGNAPGASFSLVLIAGEFSGWGTDRVRTLSGPRSAALTEVLSWGLTVLSPVYGAVDRFFSQPRAPLEILVGRKDPGDLSWTAALTAIRAASADWYAFCVPEVRDAATVEEIGIWAAAEGMQLHVAQTADSALYLGSAGNVAEDLADVRAADGVGRTVLIWHDPATASDAAAPFALIDAPAVGTYSLTPGGTLSVFVDEGAAETFTLTAAAATVTGSNNEPFALANAQVLQFGFDDGPLVSATLSATAAAVTGDPELYNLTGVIGDTVAVATDTGTDSYVIDALNYVDITVATAAEVAAEFVAGITGTIATASAAGGIPTFRSVTLGSAARFRFTGATDPNVLNLFNVKTNEVAGSGNVASVAATTAAELVTLAQAAAGSAGTASVAPTTKLRLTGSIAGTDGKVTIGAGSTAGLLTALGLSAGVTAGTGSVGNAAAITPPALSTLLDAAYSAAVTVALDSPDITITSAAGLGSARTLRFAGSLRAELGLPSGLIRGEGVEDDYADAAILGARMGISIDDRGLQTWNLAPLVGCYGDKIPAGIRRRLHEDDGVCTVEARRPSTSTPQFMTGRLVAGLASGEAVYADARIGIDWLAVRIQEAVAGLLFAAGAAGVSIPYTDRDARPALLSAIKVPLDLAFARNVISAADLTPPDPAEGKLTGLTIARLSEIGSANRALRRWEISSVQQGAGFLHQVSITNDIGNA